MPDTDDTTAAVPADESPKEPPAWLSLPESELFSMLLRRGAEAVAAKGWVQTRTNAASIEAMSEYIDREYLDENGKPYRFEVPMDRRAIR